MSEYEEKMLEEAKKQNSSLNNIKFLLAATWLLVLVDVVFK